MPPSVPVSDRPAGPAGASRALRPYRVLAYVTGVLLLLLVLVAMPLKYLADEPEMVRIVGVTHGWVYMAYVVAALVLAYQLRWSLLRTLLVVVAGTVPLASFVAERKVVADARARRQVG